MRWISSSLWFLVCAAALTLGSVPAAAGPESPPSTWLGQVEERLRDSEYHVSWQPSTHLSDLASAWHAPNRAQNLRTYFTEDGIRVIERRATEPDWEWGLALEAFGRGARSVPVAAGLPDARENRVEYSRDTITEWYVNDPRGLEQGFDLAIRPAGSDDDPIFLELALTGTLLPRLREDRQTIVFENGRGERILRYAELVTTDAGGREIPSWMEVFSEAGRAGIRLWIDDRSARYPLVVDPLTSSPVWTAEGDQIIASFASSLATAGDVNGDGYSDVIIGAPVFDNGHENEGKAWVYLGSSAGLELTPVWTQEIDRDEAQYGWSVGNGGDVNGDGFSDIIVGARLSGGSEFNEGRVWVYHGSPSGPSPTLSWSVDSDQDGAQLGYSVAAAGDVNGDGYGDVVIAAPFFDNVQSNEGRAWVHLGSATGLSNFSIWSDEADQNGAEYGWSVSTAGDVNGDGYADIIVGAPLYRDSHFDQGAAFVYYGSSSGPSPGPDVILDVDQNLAWCGWSVSTAGDVNGDGFADVLLGCRLYDDQAEDEGAVFLYEGSAAGLTNTPAWTAIGPHVDADLGFAVATAGDLNGDGFADVVAGAPGAENGESKEGMAFVWEGSSTGLTTTPTWTSEGDQTFSNYGGAVATAGDVDGDGYADLLVGASRFDNGEQDEGRAFLFYGSLDGLSETAGWNRESDQDDALLGYSVAWAGDVDGDTFGDVIIGAPFYDNGHADEGRASVFLGSGSGLETTPVFELEGGQVDSHFGWSVATAGDVNGDGFADVIMGAPGFSNGETGEGVVFGFLGSPTGPMLSPIWRGEIDQADAEFGTSVAPAGDVDGDGYGDVIVGAPNYTNGESDEGGAFLFLGSSSGLSTSADWSAEGDQADAEFGFSVSGAGDVHGDGFADVVVGVPAYDGGIPDQGRAVAYRGTPFGLITLPFWSTDGPQASSRFGHSVSTAGDVDGDGYAEVIVGAPKFTNPSSNEGAARVYEGSPSGLSASHVWHEEGNANGAEFGHSVACAGDLNGDGFADVVVGAPKYSNGHSEEGTARAFAGSAAGLAGSPMWTVESDETSAMLGWSVAAGGDVNADGFGDLLVGVPWSDNVESNEGQALLYVGNGMGGYLLPQQRQPDDQSAIGPAGASVDTDEFMLIGFARNPFGQGRLKLEWEVKPLGTPFDGVATGRSPDWLDSVLPEVPPIAGFHEPIVGLTEGTPYHWRARLLYDPAATPFQQSSRWFSVPSNGWSELDLRLDADIDVGVEQVDSKDPVFIGETYSYTIDFTNAGPHGIDSAIRDPLPPDVSFLSVVPSQGECVEAESVVTCLFGRIEPAAGATVVVTVIPQAAGVQTNDVRVGYPAALDGNLLNQHESIETTVVTPSIGNRVWEDLDGDGIQDVGEPGLVDVLVVLYDSAGALVDTAVTASDGSYTLPALVFDTEHFLRFFPPPGFVATSADQGGDDEADSDADPFSLETPLFSLVEQNDQVRWDAGMIPNCVEPDEPVYIASMAVTTDGNEYPILNFLDPNQPSQITGYNVRRSSDPVPPPETWSLVATDVIDMDEATPNKQWIDTTGDESPSGVWYYEVTGYNSRCPAEGPF